MPSSQPNYMQASYDYKKGWDTSGPHFTAWDNVDDNIEVAKAAAPKLEKDIQRFCTENDLSYIVIPHKDFKEGYETEDLNFREWLNKYCAEKNINPRADVAIMGSRIKDKESAERKTATGEKSVEDLVDYLGLQIITLKQTTAKHNNKSLKTMKRMMEAIENDSQTVGRKNHYYVPHEKTQFRAHKTRRKVFVPKSERLNGICILAEIKIEHESQMDIDKLTRKFISIGREAQRLQTDFSNSMLGKNPSMTDYRRAYKMCTKVQNMQEAMDALGAQLYNRMFADAGMDIFLNPQLADRTPPLSAKILLSAAKETIREHISSGSQQDMTDLIQNMAMFKGLSSKKNSLQRKQEKNI